MTALWPKATEYPTRKRKVKDEPEFFAEFNPEVVVNDVTHQERYDGDNDDDGGGGIDDDDHQDQVSLP